MLDTLSLRLDIEPIIREQDLQSYQRKGRRVERIDPPLSWATLTAVTSKGRLEDIELLSAMSRRTKPATDPT